MENRCLFKRPCIQLNRWAESSTSARRAASSLSKESQAWWPKRNTSSGRESKKRPESSGTRACAHAARHAARWSTLAYVFAIFFSAPSPPKLIAVLSSILEAYCRRVYLASVSNLMMTLEPVPVTSSLLSGRTFVADGVKTRKSLAGSFTITLPS